MEETIQDAIQSDNIATAIVEEAIEKEEEAIVKVEEATDKEVEAVVDYSEAVKVEDSAAEVVADAAIVQSEAVEAIVEATEKISELVDSGAEDSKVKDALSDLEETVQIKEEAEEKLSEAVEEEEQAAEALEEKVEEKDSAEEKLESEKEELKEASETLDSAIAQKDESEKELAQTLDTDNDKVSNDSEPFANGDYVTHGVYGTGEVLSTIKAGKHWSIEVNFDNDKRRILGTFLTKTEKPEQEQKSYEAPVEKLKDEKIKTYDEQSGDYKPGTEVNHKIFGKGFIRESEPKGENYKLIINFEDGSERKLLSTFIKLADVKENDAEEAVEAEPVVEAIEAEPVVEAVEAETVVEEIADIEPVVEEAVEAEPVVNNDDMFKRPNEKEETVIDLSKPEIQDAEMVDDED